MKKLFVILLLSGMIFACNQMQDDVSATPPYNGPGTKYCDSGSSNTLCSYLPIDVDTTFSVGYDSFLDSIRQPPFDQYPEYKTDCSTYPCPFNTALFHIIVDQVSDQHADQ